MEFGGKIVRVAHDDDTARRIVTEKPCDIGDRHTNRFQGTRRLVDEESRDVTGVHTHQVVDDGVDMPVWQIGRARQNRLEALPEEEAEVTAQQRGKNGDVVHAGGSTPGSG